MKFNKILTVCFAAAMTLGMASCNDGYSYGDDAIYISGTDENPLVIFGFEDTPATYTFSVLSSAKLKKDATITLAIDNSLVESYNTANGTNFAAVPDGAATLLNTSATIKEGSAASTAVSVQLVSSELLEIGPTYVIPVTITESDGLDVLETSRTIFLRLSQTITFNSLDLSNYNMYAIYPFDDSKMIDMSNGYTYEFKLFVDQYHGSSAGNIQRVINFEGYDEGHGINLIRLGENGVGWKQMQWMSPAGALVSQTTFQEGRWYHVALVYDGSSFNLFVDGKKEAVLGGSSDTQFQWMEFGMSWLASYRNSQRFLGRLAEVRVWNRALTTSEIASGLCAVATNSNGLKAYWKLNEGNGYQFKDYSGNGYDMDWKNAIRHDVDGGQRVTSNAYTSIQWKMDDNNKCTN